MLSRLANRVYWLSRYMERAGNGAKLINAYASLFLDLPTGTEVGWHTLIAINGVPELYSQHHTQTKEMDVVNFLLFDERNPGSIYSSVCFARENARTSRDILPSETWEIVNSLYLSAGREKAEKTSRSRNNRFLNTVMHNAMRLEGMLNSGLSRNNTNNFILLGRNLERADTTTRILDVGSLLLSEGRSELLRSHEGVIWVNLLRSMNAYQMYRQEVRRRVTGSDVMRFLVHDKYFPRSVAFCIDQIIRYSAHMPHPERVIETAGGIRSELDGFMPEEITEAGVSRHMDSLQKKFLGLNNIIEDSWFNSNIDI